MMKYKGMKDKGKRDFPAGPVFLAGFIVWTILIRHIDVQRAGPMGTEIGFASFNVWFHRMTGVHWATDIIGSVLLSSGLFMIYRFMAYYYDSKTPNPKPEASDGIQ